ncbi:MAG: 50S ribosomal protein L25 [Candidatus Komeilibacteria bacterium]|nr:50S ribosomal protein L25 [Candidatus Komeilibacteria bacterium]
MDHLQLSASSREMPTKDLAALKASGKVPAELYGHNTANLHLWLDGRVLEKIWRQAGENTIIDLTVEDKTTPVLIHDYQQEPVTGQLIHVDFYQVRMDEEIETAIPLTFIGESAAIETEGGILVKALDELEVACLPGALVHEITVDISALVDFDSAIKVKDLVLPKDIKSKVDGEVVVAMVDRPRSAEELASLQAEVKVELPVGAVEEPKEGVEVTKE